MMLSPRQPHNNMKLLFWLVLAVLAIVFIVAQFGTMR